MEQTVDGKPSGPENGIRDRYAELTLPHLPALYAFALRLTGEASTAEDLVQETYLKALVALPSLRQPERARSWLFQILSRLVVDRHRVADREIPVEDVEELQRFSLYDLIWEEDPLPYSERLHDDFLAQFRDEDVRRALLALPEAFRVPLVLVYTQDMTYREIAEAMDCPVGTVMSRLHRGRKILERELWECAKARGLVRTWRK